MTNHDVKAVEYFLKEEFDKMGGMDDYKEFIHFGLTSQDINNTSVPLSIKEALEQVYYPLIEELIAQLKTYATDWANIPMLAKTHGQPASPTRLGKEVMVFVYRLERQLATLKASPALQAEGRRFESVNAHYQKESLMKKFVRLFYFLPLLYKLSLSFCLITQEKS